MNKTMNSFVTRTISAVIYVILLLCGMLLGKYTFLAIMLLFLGCMMYEFMHMTMGKSYRYSQYLTILGALVFYTLLWAIRAFPAVGGDFAFLSLIPLFIVMVNSLYVKDKSEFGKFANVYTSLLYIAIPFATTILVVMDSEGNYNGLLLACFFVLIWASDCGAYLFGITLGQKYGKKLFESISPKKSWVGFWGGMLLCVAASLLFYFTGVWVFAGLDAHFTWYQAVILAILMHIAGVYGDLFESQWKRHYAVKDSGNIIPGHGGLLDRLDSTLFAVPIGIIYLSLFHLFVN